MKTIFFLFVPIALLATGLLAAQNRAMVSPRSLPIDSISIACSKTSSLIFPHGILSVDRGSRQVLAQKAKGVENILQVKAAVACFEPSSLTVVTADGNIHAFIVTYDEDPDALNLRLLDAGKLQAHLTDITQNEPLLRQYSNLVLQDKRDMGGLHTRDYDLTLSVESIFVRGELLFFRILVENDSPIDYDLDPLRFFIRDKKTAKRSAVQEVEINPVYHSIPKENIPAGASMHLVYAVPKFTIPEKQLLAVNLLEKGGNRHLEVLVKQRKMDRVFTLPQL